MTTVTLFNLSMHFTPHDLTIYRFVCLFICLFVSRKVEKNERKPLYPFYYSFKGFDSGFVINMLSFAHITMLDCITIEHTVLSPVF